MRAGRGLSVALVVAVFCRVYRCGADLTLLEIHERARKWS
jgi:hypothetical protein